MLPAARCPGRPPKRSSIRCATRSRCRSASTARSARRSCASTSTCSRSVADCYVSTHPNAGLPNAFGEYDETPERHGGDARRVRAQPACSIWSAAAAARRRRTSRRSPRRCATCAPRAPAAAHGRDARAVHERTHDTTSPRYTRLSGLEPLVITPDLLFVNVGERTNVTGCAQFRKLIMEDRYDEARRRRAPAGRERRADHRRQHGRGHARFRSRDDALPQPDRRPSPTSRACRSWSTRRSGA